MEGTDRAEERGKHPDAPYAGGEKYHEGATAPMEEALLGDARLIVVSHSTALFSFSRITLLTVIKWVVKEIININDPVVI